MLKKFRSNIDTIDKKLLELLNQRANIARQVADYKKSSNNKIIFRPDRESQIIKSLRALNKGPLNADHIHNIYREIISSCLSLETNLNVSFLGPIGTYSEIAMTKFFGSSIEKNGKNNIHEVFDSVKNKTCDYGVVPVENSNQGSIKSTLDFLIKYKVNICGEQNIPIKHCLMSQTSSIAGIKRIYAHNQTLSQCSTWLSKNCPDAEYIASDSNAQAALFVKKHKNSSCIANEICSKLYKLKIIARNVHDVHNNTTRFLIIGNTEVLKSKNDKTTFIMSLQNKAGALAKVLDVLASNKISMTKIESIPTKEKNWEYLFLIDISGHINDKKVYNALKKIESFSRFFQRLGSYPKSID
jgi:chorismate mutase/prephenate dehydratase